MTPVIRYLVPWLPFAVSGAFLAVVPVTAAGYFEGQRAAAAWKDTPSVMIVRPGMIRHQGAIHRSSATAKRAGIKPGTSLSALPSARAMADSAASLCGVPSRILRSLVARESSWNPRAVSSVGAAGLTQLMPGTARMMGVTDRFDAWQSLVGGACYLRMQFDRFGSWRRALEAYHAGPSGGRPAVSVAYAADVMEAQ